MRRTFLIALAIVFGGGYFHEHSLGRKIASGAMLCVSLVMIASPTLFHV